MRRPRRLGCVARHHHDGTSLMPLGMDCRPEGGQGGGHRGPPNSRGHIPDRGPSLPTMQVTPYAAAARKQMREAASGSSGLRHSDGLPGT
ncbi:hypothetical protein VPH35_030284 [Triticum aestivum]